MSFGERREGRRSALVPYTPAELERARREGAPFAMVVMNHEKTERGHRMTIPRETFIATTGAARKEIENLPEGKIWMGAGLVVLLKCKDALVSLVRQRDGGAPSYPYHWTPGSGMQSPDDMPSRLDITAVREGIEEFIIATKDGIVQPVFGDPELDAIATQAVADSDRVRKDPQFAHLPDMLKTDRKVNAPASFYDAPGAEELEIVHEDESMPPTRQAGILAFDPKTCGADFLKVVEIDMGAYPLSEIAIFDGETHEGSSLNGPDGCLRVEEIVQEGRRKLRLTNEFVAVYQDGMQRDPSRHQLDKMTSPLAKAFKSLDGR